MCINKAKGYSRGSYADASIMTSLLSRLKNLWYDILRGTCIRCMYRERALSSFMKASGYITVCRTCLCS